jgi:hypothetical protein
MDASLAAIVARAKEIEASGGPSGAAALRAARREQLGKDYGAGNLNLNDRPQVKNPDGSVSTVYSMTFGPEEDGKYVLVPGVRHGLDRQMTDEEAYDWYSKSGQHLGRFDSSKEADAYAQSLHEKQEKLYLPQTGRTR